MHAGDPGAEVSEGFAGEEGHEEEGGDGDEGEDLVRVAEGLGLCGCQRGLAGVLARWRLGSGEGERRDVRGGIASTWRCPSRTTRRA